MPPDVTQLTEVAQQLADHRLGLTAVWALQIAVLKQGHRGLRRPADVVTFGVDGNGQVDDRFRAADQRPQPHALGQAARQP